MPEQKKEPDVDFTPPRRFTLREREALGVAAKLVTALVTDINSADDKLGEMIELHNKDIKTSDKLYFELDAVYTAAKNDLANTRENFKRLRADFDVVSKKKLDLEKALESSETEARLLRDDNAFLRAKAEKVDALEARLASLAVAGSMAKLAPPVRTVEDRVRTIVIDQLDASHSAVVNDSKLVAELGADDLDIIELTMAIEEEFGIEINDEELPLVFGDVVKLVKTRTGQR